MVTHRLPFAALPGVGHLWSWPHTTHTYSHTHTHLTHKHNSSIHNLLTHTRPHITYSTPILHHLFSLSCLPHAVFAFLLLLVGRSWLVGLSGPLINKNNLGVFPGINETHDVNCQAQKITIQWVHIYSYLKHLETIWTRSRGRDPVRSTTTSCPVPC